MSNSTSKELDAGGERLTIIKLQDHADLVADGFKSLKNKYDPDPYYSYPRPALKDWTNPTDHEVDKRYLEAVTVEYSAAISTPNQKSLAITRPNSHTGKSCFTIRSHPGHPIRI